MKLLILPLLLLISFSLSGQSIVGKWYSQDSSRIYLIYKNADEFEAILENSSRKNDKEGAFVLRHVIYVNRKKRYEGAIYSAATDENAIPTLAKINFQDKDEKILRLRLRRIFFMNVTIKWYRVEQNKTVSL
jgi:hypothetical protein